MAFGVESELGRAGSRQTVPVRLRSLRNVVAWAGRHPDGALFVEVTLPEIRNLVAVLHRLRRDHPQLRFVAMCPEMPDWTVSQAAAIRFGLLETGVSCVLGSQRELARVLPFLDRQLEVTTTPPVEEGALDGKMAIWNRLPWKK